MATRFGAAPFRGLEQRDDAWDLVVKVKYNGTLKRFNARVNGSHFDHNLAAIRLKIASAFKFSSDVEFILTYTDEDGDLVMLDDENDLGDAAINQKLNPLRINVQLKNSNTDSPRTNRQDSSSRSPRSSTLEDQLAQVKSTIDEAMKFVPEQVPATFAKLSHDLRSRAASSVPSLAELLDRLATLITPKGNTQVSSGPVYGSSCSSNGDPQASRNTKIEHENKLVTCSASQSAGMQNALGLKSVLPEDHKSQIEQAPIYHSVDSLSFTSSAGKKSEHKGSTVAESKERCVFQSKGKSITSSVVPPVSFSTYASTPIQHTPAPSVGENKLRYWPTYGHNGLVSGGLQSSCDPPMVPPYYRHLGSSGNSNREFQLSFGPPTNTCGPSKLDIPSYIGTYVPSKDCLYPFGSSFKYNVPLSVTNDTEGKYSFGQTNNYGTIPQCVLHEWIRCNSCGVTPIVGTRYKSNVKDDYDLCGACFSHIGNEFEYTRLDKPASVNNQKLLGCLQQGELRLECILVDDITIPDGTSMAPLSPFTKIWRLRNSGCTVWPFGTQVVWVGGDQFAVQNSVKLGISMIGVAGGQEVDVAVDFLAPAKPGRYVSHWRLALPSGRKFGQPIWVLIQVEEPIQTTGKKLPAAINLNLPPAANDTSLKPFVDMNSVPSYPFYQYPLNIYNEMPPRYHDCIIRPESESKPDSATAPEFQYPNYCETFAPFQMATLEESEPDSSTLPSIPAAVKQVQVPTTDHHASFAGPALTSMAAVVPAPETIPLSKSVSFSAPGPASSVLAPACSPVQAPTSVPVAVLPDDSIDHKEEKLLRELEDLGFGQADLNKEILRQNNYDLEQSVRDLCGLSDWDPLLGELSELGLNDAAMNKEAVAQGGGGRIKGLVMNFVARLKKDP